MRLPRDVYGRNVAAALCKHWGYTKVNQVGSHIILRTEDPKYHRISIPDHKPLRLGTFSAILREVPQARNTPRDEILRTIP